MFTNNKVTINGEIVGNPTFSHEIFGERFFLLYVRTVRKSGVADVIPVLVSDRFPFFDGLRDGVIVDIRGNFRSYNKCEGEKRRLILAVLAQEISISDVLVHENEIAIEGYICKSPNHRTTPRGREITDLLLATNRTHGNSDYIPTICWGRNAAIAQWYDVGDMVRISGRIQSREYTKRISDEETEIRTAYEVSVFSIEYMEGKENERS